jgi:uncharacterized phage-associated protein
MYDARTVARSIIEQATKKQIEITNLKLQKLLYIAHGTMLAAFNRPLVRSTFSAWKYGPVMESLYHDLKVFGADAIKDSDFYIQGWDLIPAEDKDANQAIDAVLGHFGKRTGAALIEWSHDRNGPWYAVYEDHTKGIEIPDDAIKSFFKERVLKNKED